MMNHSTLPLAAFFSLVVQVAPAQINNVRVSQNPHDQSEMAIAISPLDPNLMLASWNDFRPMPNNPNGSKAGYAFSTDGGANWLPDGVIEEHNGYAGGVDPSVAFDRHGMAFYCYVASPSGGLGQIFISQSSNVGANWHHYHVSEQTESQDKPYIAIDNTGGQYDGRIYVSWTGFGTSNYVAIRFAYSTNGGTSFIGHRVLAEANPPFEFKSFELDGTYGIQEITELVQWSMPAAGPDGELYVCWFDLVGGFGNSRCRIRKSTDGGEDFGSAITIPIPLTFLDHGYVDLRNIPSMAVCPVTGNVYIAVMDQQDEQNVLRRIRLLQSTDGGSQWSSQIVGNVADGEQFFPWVSVDAAGRVSVLFLHNDSTFPYLVNAFLVESVDFGATFTEPARISEVTSDVRNGGRQYHYQGVASRPDGYTFALWTDHRNATGANPTGSDPYLGIVNLPPSPPQNIQVEATPPNQYGYRYPRITWSQNLEPDLDGYEIWRKIVAAMDCGNGVWYLLSEDITSTAEEYIDLSLSTAGGGLCTAVYRLRARDEANNLSDYSDEVSIQFSNEMWKSRTTDKPDEVPDGFTLSQNHPNPFNPSTVIRYGVPVDAFVGLKVYNILGQEAAVLVQEDHAAGWHEVSFDASSLSSGVYVYRLQTGTFTESKRMLLVR